MPTLLFMILHILHVTQVLAVTSPLTYKSSIDNGVRGAQKFVAALQDYGLIGDLFCQQALKTYDSRLLTKL